MSLLSFLWQLDLELVGKTPGNCSSVHGARLPPFRLYWPLFPPAIFIPVCRSLVYQLESASCRLQYLHWLCDLFLYCSCPILSLTWSRGFVFILFSEKRSLEDECERALLYFIILVEYISFQGFFCFCLFKVCLHISIRLIFVKIKNAFILIVLYCLWVSRSLNFS